MRKTASILIAAAAAAWMAGCARDGGYDESRNSKVAPVSGDARFVAEAAQVGMMEVELGRMAASKGTISDVRTFGQRMAGDHSAANAELRVAASRNGIAFPSELTKEHRKHVDEMAKMSGAEFDRHYMSMMVSGHNEAIAMFEEEATSGKDAAVRDFAQRTLPTLIEHRRMAEEIAGKIGG